MKEIGIFKIDKNMCGNCRKDENCPQKYSVNGNCLHIEKGLVIEQVPETWEELKKLCKDLKGKKIITTSTGIIVEDDCIEFHGLQFLKSGIICHEADVKAGFAIRLNRTPAQMWQIIKSLIGEE